MRVHHDAVMRLRRPSPLKVVWLVRNYRAESRLLALPSRLFYHGR